MFNFTPPDMTAITRANATQTHNGVVTRISQMPPEELARLSPETIRALYPPDQLTYLEQHDPSFIGKVSALAQSQLADRQKDKYFDGGPAILPPSELGPATGAVYDEATRAPGTLSAWTQMQIGNLQSDVGAQKAALPQQIQTRGQQAVEQSAMRGGIRTSQASRVPIIGQRSAMLAKQQVGQAGALGTQALKLQDEEQRRQQLGGATGIDQSMMNTQLRAWAGKKLGEAY